MIATVRVPGDEEMVIRNRSIRPGKWTDMATSEHGDLVALGPLPLSARLAPRFRPRSLAPLRSRE